MLNLSLLLVLIVEVVFFTYFDKKIYGNYFSPVVILSYPVIIIVSVALAFGTLLDFLPVSTYVMLLFIVGVFFFWIGSVIWSIIIPKEVIVGVAENFLQHKEEVSLKLKHKFQFAAWLIIIWMKYSFIMTLHRFGSIASLGTDEFALSYGGTGITGHILGLAIPLLIFFISIAKKKDYHTLLIIILLVFLFLVYRVKTWLYVPLIGGVLLRYYNNGKIRIRIIPIIISVILVMLLFALTYIFSMKEDNMGFWEKANILLKHFMGYVFAGIIGFGEHIKHNLPLGENPKTLFMPFVNLFNFMTGREVQGVVSSYHVYIDRRCIEDVNVKTFFGTILINGGYFIGIVYTIALSIFLYFVWIISTVSKNYWLLVLYIFFASALVLGWFDFYYNQLPFLELPFYIFIIVLLTHKKRGSGI